MPPDLAQLSTLISSNYPCLELIFMVPKVFEPLKFDFSYENLSSLAVQYLPVSEVWNEMPTMISVMA